MVCPQGRALSHFHSQPTFKFKISIYYLYIYCLDLFGDLVVLCGAKNHDGDVCVFVDLACFWAQCLPTKRVKRNCCSSVFFWGSDSFWWQPWRLDSTLTLSSSWHSPWRKWESAQWGLKRCFKRLPKMLPASHVTSVTSRIGWAQTMSMPWKPLGRDRFALVSWRTMSSARYPPSSFENPWNYEDHCGLGLRKGRIERCVLQHCMCVL